MSHFYVSIIFIGILLIVLSLVWIVYDRKKSYDYSKKLENQKEEMIEIMNDAEQMIGELNKFSDYIATQMELKNEEMNASLKNIEEKLDGFNRKAGDIPVIQSVRNEKVVNGSGAELYIKPVRSESAADVPIIENTSVIDLETHKTQARLREKVVPIHSKYNTVVQLSRQGMNDTEIAKTLHIGKGEIQLILGMTK